MRSKQTKMAAEASPLPLPPEIISNILQRLPVKSLLRFKCVSKPWSVLINDPFFINQHLNRIKNNPSSFSCSLNISDHDPYTLYPSPYHELPQFDASLGDDLNRLNRYRRIRGACKGILLVTLGDRDPLWLYNPSTRQYKRLPTRTPCMSHSIPRYGFGYNTVSNDYEVIILEFLMDGWAFLQNHVYRTAAQAYSLSNNSWRRIEITPQTLNWWGSNLHGEFVCGATHWVPCDAKTKLHAITAYYFATEFFYEVPNPACTQNTYGTSVRPVVFEECLGLICGYMMYFEGWTMKEYRVQQSWVKLFRVDPLLEMPSLLLGRATDEPSYDARYMFASSGCLYLYDPETQCVKNLRIGRNYLEIQTVTTYIMESLVALD